MDNEKIKVVIIQDKIPNYRVPLFKNLGNAENIDILVLHSQDKNLNVGFDNIYVKKISLSKIYIQLGLWKYCRNADVIVVALDIRWLTNIVIALFFKQKVLLWGQGFGRSRVANKFRVLLSKRAKGILLYEICGVKNFVSSGVPRNKLFYTGNTVFVEDPIMSRSDKTQFVYIGRLQHRKKIDLLIKAFAKISDLIPPMVGITILGEGDIKDDLIKLAHDMGIEDKVKYLPGTFDESKIKNVYEDAIAYVSPGDVGLGVLHSFAYGVPVITQFSNSHGPEVNDLKNGENGLILNDGIGDLSQALLMVYRDKGLQSRLGNNAYEYYINNRTMAHMVSRYLEAIEYIKSN